MPCVIEREYMNEIGVKSFIVMIIAYSFFEYFLRRIVFSLRGGLPKTARGTVMQGFCMFGIMSVGALGFVTFKLVVAFAIFALVYTVYEILWQRIAKEEDRLLLERFLVKQLIFVSLLFVIWKCNSPIRLQEWYVTFERFMLSDLGSFSVWLQQRFLAILLTVSAYLFMIDGGTMIVRGIFKKFPNLQLNALQSIKTDDGTIAGEENVGEWIGVLERWITLSFVLTSSYTAIAFALTAKSIVRFKEMDNKVFAEYYLLGTSASIIVAIIAGMAVKSVLGW